jgi:WD40 repeat protein
MLWRLGRPQRLAHWADPSAAVLTLQYDIDNRGVMSVSDTGVVETFDTASGRRVRSVALDGLRDGRRAALSADNSLVAVSSETGGIGVWRTDTGESVGQLANGHDGNVNALRFDSDGLLLASAGADASVTVWDLATGQVRNDFKLDFAAADLAFDQAQASVFAADLNGSLWKLPLMGGHQLRQLADNRNRAVRIGLSADHTRLVIGTAQDRIIINRIDGQLGISPLVNIDQMGSVDALVVSARNRVAVSDRENNRVGIWDLQSGKSFGVLPVRAPSELAMSPDQDGIAVASEGRIIIWDLNFERLLKAACSVASRNLTKREWAFYIGQGYEKTCPDLP